MAKMTEKMPPRKPNASGDYCKTTGMQNVSRALTNAREIGNDAD
jgi:hypothetical protein